MPLTLIHMIQPLPHQFGDEEPASDQWQHSLKLGDMVEFRTALDFASRETSARSERPVSAQNYKISETYFIYAALLPSPFQRGPERAWLYFAGVAGG